VWTRSRVEQEKIRSISRPAETKKVSKARTLGHWWQVFRDRRASRSATLLLALPLLVLTMVMDNCLSSAGNGPQARGQVANAAEGDASRTDSARRLPLPVSPALVESASPGTKPSASPPPEPALASRSVDLSGPVGQATAGFRPFLPVIEHDAHANGPRAPPFRFG
jgi:hypothetical protein